MGSPTAKDEKRTPASTFLQCAAELWPGGWGFVVAALNLIALGLALWPGMQGSEPTSEQWRAASRFVPLAVLLISLGTVVAVVCRCWFVVKRVHHYYQTKGLDRPVLPDQTSPEQRCYVALRDVYVRHDGDAPTLALSFRVFNGNTYPIRIAITKRVLLYGDRQVTDFEATGVDDDGMVGSLHHGHVYFAISPKCAVWREIAEDAASGKLKMVSFGQLEVEAQNGTIRGPIEWIGRAILTRRDSWQVEF